MVAIHEAIDRHNNDTVAIKIAPRRPLPPNHLRRDFEVGSKLSHPGVLRYFAIIETDEYLGIVCEPIGHLRSLNELPAPNSRDSHNQARRAFQTLFETLSYLHTSHLVHGNLTPETVLIDISGSAKLTEFGYCVGDGLAPFKDTAGFRGTPRYSSPEHQTNKLTEASDYFVFGLLFFEYVVGEPLVEANGLSDLLSQIRNTELEGAIPQCNKFTPEQQAILRSLLAKSPSDRLDGWRMVSALWRGV
ncbi:protein kinase [Acidobacteriota bacterium]